MSEEIKKLGKSIALIEELRNTKSTNDIFVGIFNGKIPFKNIFPWPKETEAERKKREKITLELQNFMLEKVDPFLIDEIDKVPIQLIEELSKMNFFALKVPEELGGRGLTQRSYSEIVGMAASWCSGIGIILSADNTIGCKFPVLYYGTPEQKERLLPELIKWPSGFCLTEKNVGSDASRIETYALRMRDERGKIVGYKITGKKWYTTNSTFGERKPLARYLAVVARIVDDPEEIKNADLNKKDCYGLFIVSTFSPGLDIGSRNQFIGMRGIHNSNPEFKNVFVSQSNLIGEKNPELEKKIWLGRKRG